MIFLSRRACLAAAAFAPLFLSLPAYAQMVTTYGLNVPSEVMGFRYSGAWQMPGPGKKPVLVVGYNGGGKGEVVAMIYDADTANPPPDDQALAKAREAFIDQMDEKSNAALNPKVVKESIEKAPGLPASFATTHITTKFADAASDLHYFMTAINGRLVGIRYKADAVPNTGADARTFATQLSLELQKM
jgi:hypothetical protein